MHVGYIILQTHQVQTVRAMVQAMAARLAVQEAIQQALGFRTVCLQRWLLRGESHDVAEGCRVDTCRVSLLDGGGNIMVISRYLK